MNHIITKEDLIDPNADLVSVLLDMMNSTNTKEVKTIHNVKFNVEGDKLRVEGPDLPVNHELMIAISHMKHKIING